MSPLRLTATAEDPRNLAAVLAPPRPGVCELVHTGEKILAAGRCRQAPPDDWNHQVFTRSNNVRLRERGPALDDAARIAAEATMMWTMM